MKNSVFLSGTANDGQSGKNTCPALETSLINLGYIVSDSPNAQFLINLNHNENAFRKFRKSGGKIENTLLILLEPESVYPIQYRDKILNKYGFKVSPGSAQFNFEKDEFIGWPYKFNLNPARPKLDEKPLSLVIESALADNVFNFDEWSSRSIHCSMVAANKVSPSTNNQYGLRRYFARYTPTEELEVYGPFWNDAFLKKVSIRLITVLAALKVGFYPSLVSCFGNLFWKYPSAHGEVENKHLIAIKSKFSLVIENNNNYVSEKLFDSIINGSIPIYYGPNLESVALPSEIAIQGGHDVISLNKVIPHLDSSEIQHKLSVMKNFITSEVFINSWTHEKVFEKIALAFHEAVGSQ